MKTCPSFTRSCVSQKPVLKIQDLGFKIPKPLKRSPIWFGKYPSSFYKLFHGYTDNANENTCKNIETVCEGNPMLEKAFQLKTNIPKDFRNASRISNNHREDIHFTILHLQTVNKR